MMKDLILGAGLQGKNQMIIQYLCGGFRLIIAFRVTLQHVASSLTTNGTKFGFAGKIESWPKASFIFWRKVLG
jgi:hypothetical protein